VGDDLLMRRAGGEDPAGAIQRRTDVPESTPPTL